MLCYICGRGFETEAEVRAHTATHPGAAALPDHIPPSVIQSGEPVAVAKLRALAGSIPVQGDEPLPSPHFLDEAHTDPEPEQPAPVEVTDGGE